MGVMLRGAATVVLLTVVGCRTAPPPLHPTGVVAGFPAERYAEAARAGLAVFDLQPERSSVRIYVYREGLLARYGHNHVIVASGWRGALLLKEDIGLSRLDVEFPVKGLRVDPPDVRRSLGGEFAAPLDQAAVEDTTLNLRGSAVLAADRFPRVGVELVGVAGAPPRPIITLDVHVRGRTERVTVPVDLQQQADRITASGRFVLRHAPLGMQPFSAAAGGLRVADAMTVEFHIVGSRRKPPATGPR